MLINSQSKISPKESHYFDNKIEENFRTGFSEESFQSSECNREFAATRTWSRLDDQLENHSRRPQKDPLPSDVWNTCLAFPRMEMSIPCLNVRLTRCHQTWIVSETPATCWRLLDICLLPHLALELDILTWYQEFISGRRILWGKEHGYFCTLCREISGYTACPFYTERLRKVFHYIGT